MWVGNAPRFLAEQLHTVLLFDFRRDSKRILAAIKNQGSDLYVSVYVIA